MNLLTVCTRYAIGLGICLMIGVAMLPTGSLHSEEQTQLIQLTTQGFEPAIVTVTIGMTVTWQNQTTRPHTLQSGYRYMVYLPMITVGLTPRAHPLATTPQKSPLFNGHLISNGGQFSHIFTQTGTYPYFLVDMPQVQGQIIVQAPPTTTITNPFTINIIKEFGFEGAVPNVALVEKKGQPLVLLVYTLNQKGLVEATSTDGITFTGIGQTSPDLNQLWSDKSLLPTDVIVRQTSTGHWRYFIKALPPPNDHTRLLYAADRTPDGQFSLINGGKPVYSGGVIDNQRVEVPDIITTLNGQWRMLYVAINATPPNSHTALSADEGLTWQFESNNPFDDLTTGTDAKTINVDPAPFRLQDGRYMAITMRSGQLYFWTSQDGLRFTVIPNFVLTAQDFNAVTGGTATALFDPTLVQLPSGEIYLYTTNGNETTSYIRAARVEYR